MDNNTNLYPHQNPEEPEISSPTEARPAEKSRRRGAKGVVALALCCSLVGGAAGAGGVLLLNRGGTASYVREGQRPVATLSTVQVDTGRTLSAAEVYAANVNSTVGITTTSTRTNLWGYATTSAAAGSGFIFTDDGYILTNYHVVEGGDALTVTMYDGTSYQAALVGFDASNDIAVLKIDASGLTPVVLGDSDQLLVGENVAAIGNPLGELTFSLTTGSVSALDREVTLEASDGSAFAMALIQTDCAINSGNSGGALFNMHGEVVGITNAKYSGSSASGASIDNIGFAIPINSVRGIVESIIEKGYIEKAYIGVSITDVSADALRYGLPAGAAVQSVTEDSPAEQAGLQSNDIVTAVNGKTVSGSSDLVDLVGQAAVGDRLILTVYRQGETLELTVAVGSSHQPALPDAREPERQPSFLPQWGGSPF